MNFQQQLPNMRLTFYLQFSYLDFISQNFSTAVNTMIYCIIYILLYTYIIYIYIYILYTYYIYIYKYSSNNNVINANCLSFDNQFLASTKDSQGVISRI